MLGQALFLLVQQGQDHLQDGLLAFLEAPQRAHHLGMLQPGILQPVEQFAMPAEGRVVEKLDLLENGETVGWHGMGPRPRGRCGGAGRLR